MKNKVLNMEFASMEFNKRCTDFVRTDLKTFQTPEFQEILKKTAIELLVAEAPDYQIKRANTAKEQCRIIEEAGDDFLHFFYFSISVQKSLLEFEKSIQQTIRKKVISTMTTKFGVSTELGQILLYVLIKKCRFHVGEMIDPSIDLILGYMCRNFSSLFEKAKKELSLAIALNESFNFNQKHYGKAIEIIFKSVPNGKPLIYYPVAKKEIGKYLLKMHNTYMDYAVTKPNWSIVQRLFCEMSDYETISIEDGQSVFDVYNSMIKFIKEFKYHYNKEWQSS